MKRKRRAKKGISQDKVDHTAHMQFTVRICAGRETSDQHYPLETLLHSCFSLPVHNSLTLVLTSPLSYSGFDIGVWVVAGKIGRVLFNND